MKKFIKKNWIFISLAILISVNSFWLIFKGMPWQHDIEFHYSRMISLTNSIRNGDFFALIHDAFFGYGYALGIFYGNFFFYIPALLCLIGVPEIVSFKLLYFLINIGTVIITYISTKGIIKDEKVSLFATILYCLSEYRLFDIFVRGAMGEMLSFMIAPLVIWGLYEIVYDDSRKWYLFTIGFVLLLLSHLITTVLMAFFCLIIIIFNYKRFIKEKIRFKHLIISGLVGVLLGSFFMFPIFEQFLFSDINILVNGSVYYPFGSSIFSLIIPKWFFSCYLGISIIILMPLRLFLSKKDIDKKYYNILSFGDLLLMLSIITWICTTNIFPWNILGKTLSFIQFPWRLLFFSTLFASISIGITLYLFSKNHYKKIINTIFVFIAVTSVASTVLYSLQYGLRKNHYTEFMVDEIGNGEYLLSNTDLLELKEKKVEFVTNNKDLIFDYDKVGTRVKVSYSNNLVDGTYIEIPLFNYLGYKITPKLKVVNGENDLIRVYLDNIEGTFEISYDGTLVQKISYSISITSLIIFSLYMFKVHRKSN